MGVEDPVGTVGTVLGTPLLLCASAEAGISGGEDGKREMLGREEERELAWLERLPVEVADLSDGLDEEPMPVRLANAVDVRSLASDAKDLLLLLWDMLPVEE